MGIRVDAEAFNAQLEIRGSTERVELEFHKALLEGKLLYPLAEVSDKAVSACFPEESTYWRSSGIGMAGRTN
jgi:hypothetical protein